MASEYHVIALLLESLALRLCAATLDEPEACAGARISSLITTRAHPKHTIEF